MRSILAQIPPTGGLEIIAVDGISDDGTREILERLAAQTTKLRVVDNPACLTACAMNLGIREAQGRYVAILGAHTEYAPDYVYACVELLDARPDVCCVGGPITSQGKSVFGQAVAAAMSHPLGVGNARHRFPGYEGYAEGACFPVFRKAVFEKVGLFDEDLIRNQDDEFYYRLAQAGEKVFLSPQARCVYFVRETPAQLFRQYFQYGFWRVAVMKKHRAPASIRQIVPAVFVLLLLVSVLIWLALPAWGQVMGAVLPVGYGAMLFSAGLYIARREGWRVGLLFPVAAAILHLAYGTGFLWGVLAGKRKRSSIEESTPQGSHASPVKP
jgi:succinoglycan biosynthesis protein ExoA